MCVCVIYEQKSYGGITYRQTHIETYKHAYMFIIFFFYFIYFFLFVLTSIHIFNLDISQYMKPFSFCFIFSLLAWRYVDAGGWWLEKVLLFSLSLSLLLLSLVIDASKIQSDLSLSLSLSLFHSFLIAIQMFAPCSESW